MCPAAYPPQVAERVVPARQNAFDLNLAGDAGDHLDLALLSSHSCGGNGDELAGVVDPGQPVAAGY